MTTTEIKKPVLEKVELEKKIDQYLRNDIPISLLTETYNITYPQMWLLINRIIGYSRKTQRLYDEYPCYSSSEATRGLVEIPHTIPEEYPLKHEEQMERFKRLEELKTLMQANEDDLQLLSTQIEEKKNKLSTYDTETLNRIEKFLIAYDKAEEKTPDFISQLLNQYGIAKRDIPKLNDLYSSYLHERESLLTLENELQRLKKERYKLETEYDNIREELVKRSIKLVNWCIRRFFNNIPLPQDEAQMYGLEGLAIAINHFDYKMGFRFSTYAVKVIVRTIERHFDELYGMKWNDFVAKEAIKYNRLLMSEADPERTTVASPTELSEMGLLGMSAKKIGNYDGMLDGIYPMSDIFKDIEVDRKPTKKNELPMTFDDYALIDAYEDRTSTSTEEEFEEGVMQEQLSEKLNEALSTIRPRDREILIKRYGLDDGIEKTLEKTGAYFGVTKDRIRQIEARGLRSLRHPSRSRQLRDFCNEETRRYYHCYTAETEKTGDLIARKLINLLETGISYDGVLVFMNMEGLGWTNDNLNQYVCDLYRVCEKIELELAEDRRDYISGTINADVLPSEYALSKETTAYIIENLKSIQELVTLFIKSNGIDPEDYPKKTRHF